MYDFMGYVSAVYATSGGAAVVALIACSIFGVVVFGLCKWLDREQAPHTEERSAGLSRAERR